MAERHSRQTIIDLDNCQFQNSYDTSPAADSTWANRVAWIYAHVLNFCYGPESGRSEEGWEFYDVKLREWKTRLPSSFQPLFYAEATDRSDSVFPSEWFLSEWHGRRQSNLVSSVST